jgi:hypothetical protein
MGVLDSKNLLLSVFSFLEKSAMAVLLEVTENLLEERVALVQGMRSAYLLESR